MHKGSVIANKNGQTVIKCKSCGFVHLDPIPDSNTLDEFYQNVYYDLIKKSHRAPEIKRIMKKDEDASSEINWLRSTQYNDINAVLSKNISSSPRTLCDIGSGTGDFIRYMDENGWNCVGVEPSNEGAGKKEDNKMHVFNCTLESFIKNNPKYSDFFDAVSLINVLEHVPSPSEVIETVRHILKPRRGIIVIRVPNDFNCLQELAQKKIRKTNWWISSPDHINYFTFDTLKTLLSSCGFEIIHITTDFPMELFLLMGDNYIDNPELGAQCHKKRISLEQSLSDEIRQKIYQSFADIGIGRNCVVFARRM
jgi:2-polyprenyl-3-methyl-5-hydroxy-6-metoxy-1,4-benzoquinol methylase